MDANKVMTAVLLELANQYQLTKDGGDLIFSKNKITKRGVDTKDAETYLRKLQNDHDVLTWHSHQYKRKLKLSSGEEVEGTANVSEKYSYYITLKPDKFIPFYNDFIKENNLTSSEGNRVEDKYSIEYNPKARKILLNKFLLAKPDFDSENERFFTYVYENQNQRITRKVLEDNIGKVGKTFHQIVSDLGFKYDLAKAFFSISKTAIEFRNPVSKKDLEELEIEHLKIQARK